MRIQRMGRAFLLATALAAAIAGAADAASISASVQSREVEVGRPFYITVSASGERIAEPIIPHSDAIRFERTPVSKSQTTRVEIVNRTAQTVMTRQWVFEAVPRQEGSISIPPIRVRIDGQDHHTEAIALNAAPPPDPGAAQEERTPGGTGAPDRRDTDTPPAPTWEDVVFIEAKLSAPRAYQGEELLLTLGVWKLNAPSVVVRYTGPRYIQMPTTEGFYEGPVVYRESLEMRNGFQYRVEWYQRRLYPTGSGTLEVGPWAWQGIATAHTPTGPQRRQYTLRTDPVDVEVLPLPPRPQDFTGAVGKFELRANLLETDLEQGEPTELVLRINGRGNPDAISAPPLPDMPWAHISGPATNPQPNTQREHATTERVFSYTLIPLEAGTQTIPPVSFTYFDPGNGRYETLTADPIELRVAPAEGVTSPVLTAGDPGASQIDILADDIHSILPAAQALRPSRENGAASGIALAGPPVLYAGIALFLRRRRRFQEDSRYARDYLARSRNRKRLKHLENAPDPAEALHRALAGFVADKLYLNESGLTSEDTREVLEARGVPEELVKGIVKVMRASERARYAGAKLSPEELHALKSAALKQMDALDDALRKEAAR